MADKKAQTKQSKIIGMFLMLVLCVTLVIGAAVFTDVLTPSGIIDNETLEAEWNITDDSLREIKWAFNETNSTVYNKSNTVFLSNFDNRSSLGENDTNIVDISSSGNNATNNGSIFNETNGKYDGSFWFDGVDDYMDTTSTISTGQFANGMVWGGWVYHNHVDKKAKMFSDKFSVYFSFTDSNTRRLVCSVKNETDFIEHSDQYFLPVGEEMWDSWHYLTCRFNGTHIEAFIDGESDGNSTELIGTLRSLSNNYFSIGTAGIDRLEYLNGSVDNVLLLNSSISDLDMKRLYSTSVTRYNQSNWNLYTNESMETNITGISYNYYACSTNTTGYENCTDEETVTRVLKKVTINSNFSNSLGNIKTGFYGVANGGWWMSNESGIDTTGNGFLDTLSNYTWSRNLYLESNMENIRTDTAFVTTSLSEGVWREDSVLSSGNNGRTSSKRNLVEWAYNNSKKVLFIAHTMPDWLADKTSECASSNATCAPTNYTKWGDLVVDYLDYVDCDLYPGTCEVEVWNEPDREFWLVDLPRNDSNKTLKYNLLYNATYNAVKAWDSAIPVIGPSISTYNWENSSIILNGFLGNFSDKMDGVSFHTYRTETPFDLFDENIYNDTEMILERCAIYGANCSNIVISEWNVNTLDLTYNASRVDEFGMQIALAYLGGINNYAQNMSMYNYHWASFSSYTDTVHYPEYPARWDMVSDPLLDDTIYISYNSTKNFATYHSAGSTVYESTTTQSAVKAVSSKNSNEHYITVINTDTEARNITVDTSGTLTKLYNMETGEEFSSDTGVFVVGVMDSYEILYLGYQGISGGLVCQMNLDENSGTTAYDLSGNSNNGIISGALWFTDGLFVTLTAITDYTLNPTTGLFTITNTDYSWAELQVAWSYVSGEDCPAGINPSTIGGYFGAFISGLLSFLGIIGVILGVIWLVGYVIKLFSKGGLNDLGQTA